MRRKALSALNQRSWKAKIGASKIDETDGHGIRQDQMGGKGANRCLKKFRVRPKAD